jgi:hypothetical protein
MNVTDCSTEREAVGVAVTLLAILVTLAITALLLDAKYNHPGGGADDTRYAVDSEDLIPSNDDGDPPEEVLHRFMPDSCPPGPDGSGSGDDSD